jgi:hypothetical protein
LAVKHGIESGLDEVQLVPKCFKDKSILMTHFFSCRDQTHWLGAGLFFVLNGSRAKPSSALAQI